MIVEEPVYDELCAKLKAKVDALVIGDPTERTTYWGPVINQSSYNDFKNFTEEINGAGGKFLTGGHVKTGGDFAQVAESFSDAQDALTGGNLGWRSAARLPTVFVEVVRGLEKGGVSNVLRSPAGFHIVTTPSGSNVTIASGDASMRVARIRYAAGRSISSTSGTDMGRSTFIKGCFGKSPANL